MKQKTAEALKGIKIDEFKSVLSSGKNISIDVLHQMESILKVTNKSPIFINKFCFGGPPCIVLGSIPSLGVTGYIVQ